MQKVTDKLKEYSCVTVIGPPASGKSSIIHHVALQWQNNGYELIPIISKHYKNKPLELLKSNINNSESRKLFVVDDFCGVDNVDVVAVDAWKSHFKELNEILINTVAVKILISCRKSIIESNRFTGLAFMTANTYKIDKNSLSEDEKKSILEKYIPRENVSKLCDLIDFKSEHFPLFCKIAASRHIDIEEKINIHSIEKDISDMPDEEFISIFVCLLFDEFSYDWIEREKRPKRVDKAIECLLKKCIKLDFDEALQLLPIDTGTYVKKGRNGYSLVHKFINDIVFVKCEKRAEGVFLQYASPSIIATRFRFVSIRQNSERLMDVAISTKKQYFERLKKDLKNEDLDSTFHNNQLMYPTYRRKLLHYIKTNNEMTKTIKNLKTERKPLIEIAMEGYNDLIQMLIHIHGQKYVNVTDSRGRSALHIAAEKGYKDVVKSLLDNGAKNLKDKQDRTPLEIAHLNGHEKIVKMVMKTAYIKYM
ncbi:Hypothetical predicted protein [Mytilus galloprovincialis]|uniref:Novel STAND NTPase 3 domain-containing protein n=1 Tax=Mytilus galloprovincialis TaxID=29158 RepID=A0A8B6GPR1_MYTGA|nr:Hypothetical predicted protein [Mytilus galloprovincialis]